MHSVPMRICFRVTVCPYQVFMFALCAGLLLGAPCWHVLHPRLSVVKVIGCSCQVFMFALCSGIRLGPPCWQVLHPRLSVVKVIGCSYQVFIFALCSCLPLGPPCWQALHPRLPVVKVIGLPIPGVHFCTLFWPSSWASMPASTAPPAICCQSHWFANTRCSVLHSGLAFFLAPHAGKYCTFGYYSALTYATPLHSTPLHDPSPLHSTPLYSTPHYSTLPPQGQQAL